MDFPYALKGHLRWQWPRHTQQKSSVSLSRFSIPPFQKQPTSDHPVADVQESPTTPLPFCKIDHQASTRSSLTQPSVIVISPKMGDYVKGNKNVEVARESDEKLQLKKPMLEMVYKTRRSFKRFTQIMLEKKNSVWRSAVQT